MIYISHFETLQDMSSLVHVNCLLCNCLVLPCLTSTQIAWLIPTNLGWMLPCCIVVEADRSISMSALAKFPFERKGTCPKPWKFGETSSYCSRRAKGPCPYALSPFWRRIRSQKCIGSGPSVQTAGAMHRSPGLTRKRFRGGS